MLPCLVNSQLTENIILLRLHYLKYRTTFFSVWIGRRPRPVRPQISAAFDAIHCKRLNLSKSTGEWLWHQWLCSLLDWIIHAWEEVMCNHQTGTISSGFPQGSCLGSLLFVMYTSRLFHMVEMHLSVKFKVFADDTQLNLLFCPTSSISSHSSKGGVHCRCPCLDVP